MDKRLERILPRVQKPARYIGGEYNEMKKDPAQVDTRIAFCFPDTYEIGMSNLGMRILYGVMNGWTACGASGFCPLARHGSGDASGRDAGSTALETGDPITDFDIVGLSVGMRWPIPPCAQYAGSGRASRCDSLQSASGLTRWWWPAVPPYNAEPLADFIDTGRLGEGEDITVELVELIRRARGRGGRKSRVSAQAAQMPGIYIPALYEMTYHDDGTVNGDHAAGWSARDNHQTHRPRYGRVLFSPLTPSSPPQRSSTIV